MRSISSDDACNPKTSGGSSASRSPGSASGTFIVPVDPCGACRSFGVLSVGPGGYVEEVPAEHLVVDGRWSRRLTNVRASGPVDVLEVRRRQLCDRCAERQHVVGSDRQPGLAQCRAERDEAVDDLSVAGVSWRIRHRDDAVDSPTTRSRGRRGP